MSKLTPEQLKKQYENDLTTVMASEQGRRLVWEMLSRCGMFHLSYTGNSETFFREGKRSIGLELWADLERVCPRETRIMFNEARLGE